MEHGLDKTYAKTYDTCMTTISATQARTKLYDLIEEVYQTGERVGITKKGETRAVLVSQEELASLEATLNVMTDPKLVCGIKKGIKDVKAGRLIDWEDVKKKFGM